MATGYYLKSWLNWLNMVSTFCLKVDNFKAFSKTYPKIVKLNGILKDGSKVCPMAHKPVQVRYTWLGWVDLKNVIEPL